MEAKTIHNIPQDNRQVNCFDRAWVLRKMHQMEMIAGKPLPTLQCPCCHWTGKHGDQPCSTCNGAGEFEHEVRR